MSERASEMPQKSKEKRMSSPRYARARATRSSAFGSARSTVFGLDAVDKRCDEANGEEAQQVIQNERPEQVVASERAVRRARAPPARRDASAVAHFFT